MSNVIFSSLLTPRNMLRANGQCSKYYTKRESSHMLRYTMARDRIGKYNKQVIIPEIK